MRRTLAIAGSLLALTALAAIGATAAAAKSPQPTYTYTCTKPKKNGELDVQVSVPASAVGGLTNAGYTCVANAATEEDENGDQGDQGPEAPELGLATAAFDPPSESRALFCSTKGPVDRADPEGAGVALNLPMSEGARLVEQGLANPGIFYAGVGVSCDLLPGFTYSGLWVDHVGNVAPGDAVYPYYVPAG
jgi:hypothetical protein